MLKDAQKMQRTWVSANECILLQVLADLVELPWGSNRATHTRALPMRTFIFAHAKEPESENIQLWDRKDSHDGKGRGWEVESKSWYNHSSVRHILSSSCPKCAEYSGEACLIESGETTNALILIPGRRIMTRCSLWQQWKRVAVSQLSSGVWGVSNWALNSYNERNFPWVWQILAVPIWPGAFESEK